jgi:hypothetical protein
MTHDDDGDDQHAGRAEATVVIFKLGVVSKNMFSKA